MYLRLSVVLIAVCASIFAPASALAQSSAAPERAEAVANAIAASITAKLKTRAKVTVLDFTDIEGKPVQVGRYLALDLSTYLVNLDSVSVLDRANLATIMEEHQLTQEGLLKPSEGKKLGQFAGVDAYVIGMVVPVGETEFEIQLRAIATETSEVLAAKKYSISATADMKRMYDQVLFSTRVASAGPSDAPPFSGAAAGSEKAMAVKDVGPVRASLISVAEFAVPQQNGSGPTQAIRCTVELQNRSSQSRAAVAATQEIGQRSITAEQLGSTRCRGGLTDGKGSYWKLVSVSGVPGVVCFEAFWAHYSDWKFEQSNPSGVADYVRTGTHWDKRADEDGKSKRYWMGSFDPIEPGGSTRITLIYERVDGPNQHRSGSTASKGSGATGPVQFNVEMVLGTIGSNEKPEESKDLRVQGLSFENVTLGPSATPPKDS